MSASGDFQTSATEYVESIRNQTIIGRLAGARRVPINTRVCTQTSGDSVGWIREGDPIPVGKMAFAADKLPPRKVGSMVLFTDETARFSSPSIDALVRTDLDAAAISGIDSFFIDPSIAAVAGKNPASITNGVSTIVSTGNPSKDLAALINAFTGDLSKAYLITDGPRTVR